VLLFSKVFFFWTEACPTERLRRRLPLFLYLGREPILATLLFVLRSFILLTRGPLMEIYRHSVPSWTLSWRDPGDLSFFLELVFRFPETFYFFSSPWE